MRAKLPATVAPYSKQFEMNFVRSNLSALWDLFNASDKKNARRIIALLIVNSLLDIFNLASFLPLLYAVMNPNFVSDGHFMSSLLVDSGIRSTRMLIIILTALLVLFTILKNILSRWIIRQKAQFAFDFGSQLSSRVLGHYLETSYLQFTQADFSNELNRIANHPIAFANNIVMPAGTIFSESILMVILVLFLFIYNPIAALFIIFLSVPLVLLFRFIRKNSVHTGAELTEIYPLTMKYALQAVEGVVEIKTLRKEVYFRNRFARLSAKLARTFARDHVAVTDTSRLTEVLVIAVTAYLIVYSVWTNQNYQQTVMLLGIYVGISFRIIPSINRILHSFQQIKTHEFLFGELSVGKPIVKNNSRPADPGIVHLEKELSLVDISFRYPNLGFSLESVSIHINKGEKVLLSGKSGSGKTTLLLILLGYLRAERGDIKLDGKVMDPSLSDGWRKLFGYVSQNPYILDASILENIALGIPPDEVRHEKINHLMELLDLTPLIHQFPLGIHTPIGEKGIRLSGGQRQRIAIARALYDDAEILLLDEITNHQDPETTREIMNALSRVSSEGKTVIMISHQSFPNSNFNRTIRLHNGAAVEHETLVPSGGPNT